MLQMSEQERMQKLMEWSEEQPHLFGFLVNLADDFPSREHQALSLLPLVVQESFRRMGMSVDAIAPDLLQKCIEEQVENAEKKEQAEEEERTHAAGAAAHLGIFFRSGFRSNGRSGRCCPNPSRPAVCL